MGKRRGGGSPLLGVGVHTGWARDKGSRSFSQGECTLGGQETRGVVVSRLGGGGSGYLSLGGVHMGWARDKGSGSLSLGGGGGAHGVGKRQGEW